MENLELLNATLYKTIEDINVWQDVLSLVCEISGADKGIIALRDQLTAEIVIPEVVEEELQSPLIFGFSQDEVESYIGYFWRYDPWTEIEKLYHPHTPYALSKHLGRAELVDSKFWEWLEPQSIDDTVVLELGSAPKYWTAMNLYYNKDSTSIREKILDVVTELEPKLQDIWRYGQLVRAAKSPSRCLEYLLEQKLHASFMIEQTGKVVTSNSKAKVFLSEENCLSVDLTNRLLPSALSSQQQMTTSLQKLSQSGSIPDQASVYEMVSLHDGFSLRISPIFSTEDTVGDRECLYLVKILTSDHTYIDIDTPIWKTKGLSPKERQLVELLANGKKVVDYQKENSVAKSTAHFHWANVKKKLKVKDRSEIFAKHQLYLKNR